MDELQKLALGCRWVTDQADVDVASKLDPFFGGLVHPAQHHEKEADGKKIMGKMSYF